MTLRPFTLETIAGKTLTVPDPSISFVHLQFRRFSGCPICNAHLRSFAKHRGELDHAGIHEVIFFHSSAAELRTYEANIPFDVVADPEKTFYRQFGVESAARSLLHPAILGAALRGARVVFKGRAARLWIPKAENGRLGLPADFLIDRTGRVVASKHGRHAYDQWDIGELLTLAQRATGPAARPTRWNGLPRLAGFPTES